MLPSDSVISMRIEGSSTLCNELVVGGGREGAGVGSGKGQEEGGGEGERIRGNV